MKVTISKFQELYKISLMDINEAEKSALLVQEFTGMSEEQVNKMPLKKFNSLCAQINRKFEAFGVELDNKKIKGPGPDRGIVFQNYSLLPWLSVHENIFQAVDSVMDCTKKEKHEIVEKNLKMVNLYEHKDKLPGQLSGGMKQRVAIARAFAINAIGV